MLIWFGFGLLLYKLDKYYIKNLIIAFTGIIIFQYFTQSMWLNLNLEPWSYFYLDVNWILTLGWTIIFLVPMKIVDLYFNEVSKIKNYIISVCFVSLVAFIAEPSVVYLGIRQYSSDVLLVLSGNNILGTPVEALYYIPVMVALIISFIKYWRLASK